MTPRWLSQVVPPLGAIKAEGIKNQLGRPDIDRLTVLVREAAQNSWDARLPGLAEPVRFSMELSLIDRSRAAAWRKTLARGAPRGDELPLSEVLAADELRVLFVSDRGTTGLGGPTRAGTAVGALRHDYLSFVLNVGDPRDTPEGGGTFGFGKAVYFLSSQASSVLVHTHCAEDDGTTDSRLIGIALGPSFERDRLAYTGRHWFGLATDDAIEPIRGDEADRLALALGFPPFDDEETGTTIAIIGVDLDGRPPEDVGTWLTDSVLWHLWPKMVDRGSGPPMKFAVTVDGRPAPVPDPHDHAAINEFAAALAELDDVGQTINYGSYQRPIGRLNIRTTFAPPPRIDPVGDEAGFGAGVRHVCLLRSPELVVEYRPGLSMPDEHVWYAGVFRVFAECDDIFAAAEPPTHDAWNPAQLNGRDRSVVRKTLEKIDVAIRNHSTPAGLSAPGEGRAEGLAAASRMLGGLLAPVPGAAAGPRKGGSGSGGRRSAVKSIGTPRWIEHLGQDVLAQAFEVTERRAVLVEGTVAVRMWGGGSESEPPQGATGAAVVAWRAPGGEIVGLGQDRVTIRPDEAGRWELLVSAPEDAATSVRVRESADGRR